MTDRELLELAAKAAGIDPEWCDERPGIWIKEDGLYRVWNPLTDDGDALRLAVTLRLDVWHHRANSAAGYGPKGIVRSVGLDVEDERPAATRRAIVRAAAAIAARKVAALEELKP